MKATNSSLTSTNLDRGDFGIESMSAVVFVRKLVEDLLVLPSHLSFRLLVCIDEAIIKVPGYGNVTRVYMANKGKRRHFEMCVQMEPQTGKVPNETWGEGIVRQAGRQAAYRLSHDEAGLSHKRTACRRRASRGSLDVERDWNPTSSSSPLLA